MNVTKDALGVLDLRLPSALGPKMGCLMIAHCLSGSRVTYRTIGNMLKMMTREVMSKWPKTQLNGLTTVNKRVHLPVERIRRFRMKNSHAAIHDLRS